MVDDTNPVLGTEVAHNALPHGQEKEPAMADNQNTIPFTIPPRLVNKQMTDRDYVSSAQNAQLTDAEKSALPNWAVKAIETPTDELDKTIKAALVRLEFVRLELFRASVVDGVIGQIDYRLKDDAIKVLRTPLPSVKNKVGEDHFAAKNTLLGVLNFANRFVKTVTLAPTSDESTETTVADETTEAPAVKAPRKRAAKRAAAPAPVPERPALVAV